MFLEGPSTRTMLDGFMIKKNREFGEFQSLVGFNLSELSYELIQATTLLYFESLDIKTPCQIGQMTVHQHNIYINILDNNNAILHIDFFSHSSVDIKYNYRTDNFATFNVTYISGNYVARDSVARLSRSTSIPSDAMLAVLSDISTYIPHLLWRTYQKRMSEKK